MHPLPFQVRSATNHARNVLLGPDWAFITSGPKPDDENDFAGLKARIERAVEALETADLTTMEAWLAKGVGFWPSGMSVCFLFPFPPLYCPASTSFISYDPTSANSKNAALPP